MATAPETYFFLPTKLVPNSILPVLVYRNALPKPYTEDTAQVLVESNGWTKKGTWGAVPRSHFHPNTHECYAVIGGQSTLLVGCDSAHVQQDGGQYITLMSGDVIVLPAGVAHCSTDTDPNYRYIGAYPSDAPRWKNEYGKTAENMQALSREAAAVPIPTYDPVEGVDGPMLKIWRSHAKPSLSNE